MKVVELAKVGLVPLMPGVSGVFDSVQMASKRVTANTALFMQFAVSGSIGVLVHHASRSARAGFTTALNLWCVGATFMFYLALRKYLTCMGEHPAGLVIGLTSAYPLVTQAADCAILGDPFHPTMVLACLFILGGCFQLLARDEEHQQISTKILWAAVIATVGFGLTTIFEKEALESASNSATRVTCQILMFRGAMAIGGVVAQSVTESSRPKAERPERRTELREWREWVFGALSSLFSAGGTFAYMAALTWMPVMAVTVLFALYPAVTYLLDVAFKREKISWKRGSGIGLMILGAVAASI